MAALPTWEKNMEEKKEIRKKIFKARKEHEDAWIQMKADIQAYADSLS